MFDALFRWRRDRSDRQLRFLSQAIQLEETVNPYIVRMTLMLVSSLILAFILWASFTNINEVARTSGEVIPQGKQQLVQHLEGGIVENIHVNEGDMVVEGETLIDLSNASIMEDHHILMGKHVFLQLQSERLRAFIEKREPDFSQFDLSVLKSSDQNAAFASMRLSREQDIQIVSRQIEQKRESERGLIAQKNSEREKLEIANQIYENRKSLADKGLFPQVKLMEEELKLTSIKNDIAAIDNKYQLIRREIREYESRLESVKATQSDQVLERLNLTLSEISQNAKSIDKLNERIQRLSIVAPVSGRVKGISVNTQGEVLGAGETVMEIVPQDRTLEVHVKISPKDIGYLRPGQPVQVKFSAFDFSRYGAVQGKLQYISAATFTETNGGRFYKGTIRLDRSYVGADPRNKILPGMTVMADIATGEKTILQYLLKPIHVSLKTAFTER